MGTPRAGSGAGADAPGRKAVLIWPLELQGGALAGMAMICPAAWCWAAASGVVYYALAFWLFVFGLRGMSASLAGLFLNLISVFAVAGAAVFLGERLTTAQWVGLPWSWVPLW